FSDFFEHGPRLASCDGSRLGEVMKPPPGFAPRIVTRTVWFGLFPLPPPSPGTGTSITHTPPTSVLPAGQPPSGTVGEHVRPAAPTRDSATTASYTVAPLGSVIWTCTPRRTRPFASAVTSLKCTWIRPPTGLPFRPSPICVRVESVETGWPLIVTVPTCPEELNAGVV